MQEQAVPGFFSDQDEWSRLHGLHFEDIGQALLGISKGFPSRWEGSRDPADGFVLWSSSRLKSEDIMHSLRSSLPPLIYSVCLSHLSNNTSRYYLVRSSFSNDFSCDWVSRNNFLFRTRKNVESEHVNCCLRLQLGNGMWFTKWNHTG